MPVDARAWQRRACAAALLLTSAVVSLGLAELALRLVAPRPPSWLAIYRQHPELPIPAALPDLHSSVDTGETHWQIFTDSEGFRVGGGRVEGDCAALWLGDSFAFGHGVDYGQSLVGMVGAAAPRVRQINTALPGYGPVQYRQVLENLLAHGRRFDYVYVVSYVGNDFHDCIWDKTAEIHEGAIGHRADLKSFAKTHSHLYRLLSAVAHRFAPDDAGPGVEAELADPTAWNGEFLERAQATYDGEMARLQALARAHGAQVRFVILPTRAAVDAARDGGDAEPAAGPLLPVARARAALTAIDAQFIDASVPLSRHPSSELYFNFDGHLTEKGNRVVADAVVQAWPLACASDSTSR